MEGPPPWCRHFLLRLPLFIVRSARIGQRSHKVPLDVKPQGAKSFRSKADATGSPPHSQTEPGVALTWAVRRPGPRLVPGPSARLAGAECLWDRKSLFTFLSLHFSFFLLCLLPSFPSLLFSFSCILFSYCIKILIKNCFLL